MKPKITIHAGTEKTGSTSIQTSLHSSYRELMRHGILFPSSLGAPCHIHLTACALTDNPVHPIRRLLDITDETAFQSFSLDTKHALAREIEEQAPKRIIISDEHINVHLCSIDLLQEYKRICEEYGDIESVVIYLRRQDEFRISLFSEAVKMGNLKGFDIDNPLKLPVELPYRFNYLSILNNFSEVFGRDVLDVRVFDRERLPGGDVLTDFIQANKLPISPKKLGKNKKNRSIDRRVIRNFAKISSYITDNNIEDGPKLRERLINILAAKYNGPGPLMSREHHTQFMARFQHQNNEIKRYFMEPMDGDLFSEPKFYNPPYPDCSLSWEELFIDQFSESDSFLKNLEKAAFTLMRGNDGNKEQQKEDKTSTNNRVDATCLICGKRYMLWLKEKTREKCICPGCSSSGRANALMYCLSMITMGRPLPVSQHPTNNNMRIVGLSDSKVYSKVLSTKYNYSNMFFHKKPYLDIRTPPEEMIGTVDILISTEVFEHVIGDSMEAFRGAFKLLKPGGHTIFSVPYINKGDSVEHYREDLVDYRSFRDENGTWCVELIHENGAREIDRTPRFHGGPGKTLEIRLFNLDRVIRELHQTGFRDVTILEDKPEYGIYWGPPSRVLSARKPVSLDEENQSSHVSFY
ncbi:methyltransferase domain-containing protein [Thiolapillus brandeum]|nr:methyltransferase domain-containing protein [Thiolapillus brandeum]